MEQSGYWEPILRGSSCGAGQVTGNTWAQHRPSGSTGRGQQQHPRQVNAMIRAFYLLLWSVGAWPRAVENMDQVGRVKLCVSCAGTDLLLSF